MRDASWLLGEPAEEGCVEAGVQLALLGHVVAARYNKPEGLQAWLKREGA